MKHRHHIGSTPPPLDSKINTVGKIKAICAYLSSPEALPEYIQQASQSFILLSYPEIAKAIAANPNSPLDAVCQDKIVWGQAESFIQNPAIPLYLLENPSVFLDYLKTEIGYNNKIVDAMQHGFGWKESGATDYQLAMRELFLGPVVGKLSAFGCCSPKNKEDCNLPLSLYLTAHGFLVVEYSWREFFCLHAKHLWDVYQTELVLPHEPEEWMRGVTFFAYFNSATKRTGNWQLILQALPGWGAQ